MQRTIHKLIVAVWFTIVSSANAATYPAATANLSDVQSAVNLAVDGDTVTVPVGNVGWTSHLVISHDIFLLGSGIGQTIITNGAADANAIIWSLNTSGKAAISGFEFRGGTVPTPFTGIMILSGTCFMWRCCSNAFILPNNRCIQQHGWIYGVYDHNVTLVQNEQFIEIWHDGYGNGNYGDLSWNDPDFEGTTNGTYLEDNYFSDNAITSAAIDCMGGGRYVDRFNTFSNQNDNSHGTESTGRQRSIRHRETYKNKFIQISGFNASSGQMRGGVLLCYSNSYVGPDWQFGVNLVDFREIYSFAHWGAANGTNGYDSNSPTIFATGTHTGGNNANILTDNTKSFTMNQWVGTNILWNVTRNMASVITANTATTVTFDQGGSSVTGGPNMIFNTGDTYQIMAVCIALDQCGRGQQSTPFNSASDPATPVVWPNQAQSPCYSWSNTVNGVSGMNIASGYPSILSGRDYFADTIKPSLVQLVYPHPLIGPFTPSDPVITLQPTDQTVTAPATATFTCGFSGATWPGTIQWYKNSVAIGGATSTSYTTPATTGADDGTHFYAIGTDTGGSAQTITATLHVTSVASGNSSLRVGGGILNIGNGKLTIGQ